ncbi:metallophosphoesterase [bacterium]
MKIFAIADIHEDAGLMEYVASRDAAGDYDVLLLAGDIAYSREKRKWVESLTRETILIPGNWDGGPLFDEPLEGKHLHKLRFGLVKIGGVDFLCSGDYRLEILEEGLELARDSNPGRLVLVTHHNPFQFRDGRMDENSGYREVLRLLRKLKPAVHVFGHDHEGRGECMFGGTRCINVSAALGGMGVLFEI